MKTPPQAGFSLFETLIAMLIAAVGVAAVMAVHLNNLRHVRDHADLNRAQLVLNNAVYRLQQTIDTQKLDASSQEQIRINTIQNAQEAGLVSPVVDLNKNNLKYLVQLEWQAHDANQAVVRTSCVSPAAGNHCLAMWVAP